MDKQKEIEKQNVDLFVKNLKDANQVKYDTHVALEIEKSNCKIRLFNDIINCINNNSKNAKNTCRIYTRHMSNDTFCDKQINDVVETLKQHNYDVKIYSSSERHITEIRW